MKTKDEIIANLKEQNDILKTQLKETAEELQGWKEWKENEINGLLLTLQSVKSDLDDIKDELDDNLADRLDSISETFDELDDMNEKLNDDENTKGKK